MFCCYCPEGCVQHKRERDSTPEAGSEQREALMGVLENKTKRNKTENPVGRKMRSYHSGKKENKMKRLLYKRCKQMKLTYMMYINPLYRKRKPQQNVPFKSRSKMTLFCIT